jgi:hypothetical protein
MPNGKIQFFCETDGCAYCWEQKDRKWFKTCPVDELPRDVQTAVLDAAQSIPDTLVVSKKLGGAA